MIFGVRNDEVRRMTASPEVKYRGILDYDTPIECIDTAIDTKDLSVEIESEKNSFIETVTENNGKINKDEALLTLATLQNYIERIGIARILQKRLDIGIISPYKAQVQFIRRLLKQTPFFKPIRKLITVNTVDGFQSQERDIIVISMVRSNEVGQIGFLRDLRRMNVAMTRTRMKLLIIENSQTLSKHRFYRELHSYIKNLGTNIESDTNISDGVS